MTFNNFFGCSYIACIFVIANTSMHDNSCTKDVHWRPCGPQLGIHTLTEAEGNPRMNLLLAPCGAHTSARRPLRQFPSQQHRGLQYLMSLLVYRSIIHRV